MLGRNRPHRLTRIRPARTIWRRVIRCAEPLETRQLLSAAGLMQAALDDVLALPAAHVATLITSPTPLGDAPAQIRHAYGFDQVTFSSGGQTIAGDGSGQTIAVVDAYGDSKIAADLHTFDAQFGLPDPVLKVVNQNGGSKLPGNNSGWALETALDVEWAHAMAPKANLLLVEATTSSLGNLLTAVDYARKQPGVVAVSMSWGSSEFASESLYDSHFTTPAGHSGVTFLAASGDNGAGALWPAVSPNVLSVGGTVLSLADSEGDYGSETTWSGSGGGVSLYEPQPTFQTQSGLVTQSTTHRATPDVAYNAAPASGVAVYNSLNYGGQSGWFQVGGTSAAAPQWAALVAIADQGRQIAGGGSANPLPNAQAAVYGLASNATSYSNDFHDVTTGGNGAAALDQAGAGFDLATGLGTPNVAALVQGLVNAQGTAVITTTASALKGGTGSSGGTTIDPSVVIEIIVLEAPPPFGGSTSSPFIPLIAEATPNTAAPATSLVLPVAIPMTFATNSLITDDDPLAAPLSPTKRGADAPAHPDSTEPAAMGRSSDLSRVWDHIVEDSLLDACSTISGGTASAVSSAAAACFADAHLTDALAEMAGSFGSTASVGARQFAGLAGLLLAAVIVDRQRSGEIHGERRGDGRMAFPCRAVKDGTA